MMDDMLLNPFVRMLGDICTPQAVRAVEAGGRMDAMWAALVQSGFLDALVPEAQGGAGLDLGDVAPLFFALGAHAMPLPVAQTMAGRALLGMQGVALPVGPLAGPLVLADLSFGQSGLVPAAMVATHVLADRGDRLCLFEADALEIRDPKMHASLAASIRLMEKARPMAELARPDAGLKAIAAILRAAEIAGAASHVLEMAVGYAGERIQFGKPIGKQQAVQQNLAVLAEKSVLVGMAARIGCAGGLDPRIEVAAIAKQVASAAAVEIANIAHAVHGAIGISEEYDLQLFTRRLHEWRVADGSESYWADILGHRRLASEQTLSADYVRSVTQAVTQAVT